MSNRERAVDLLQMLPEEKIIYAICFLEGLLVSIAEEQDKNTPVDKASAERY